MNLFLFRTGPLAEALRGFLAEPSQPDAPAVLADLIDLRGGVELAEQLDQDLVVPPPIAAADHGRIGAAVRVRVQEEVAAIQARLDEALSQPFKPRYRLPTAQQAFELLQQSGALETRKGAPLKTGLRSVLAPFHAFTETHLKRARFALRALRVEIGPDLLALGGEGAAVVRLEEGVSHALHPRMEALFRRAARASEERLAAALTTAIKGLPATPTEADLAPTFLPESGSVSKVFAESCALAAAIFAFERRWLDGLLEAALG